MHRAPSARAFRCPDVGRSLCGRLLAPWRAGTTASQAVVLACSGLIKRAPTRRLFAGLVSTIGGSDAGFLDGAADQARFHYPHSAAVSPDGSKLFVSDGWNQRIRVVLLSKGARAPLPASLPKSTHSRPQASRQPTMLTSLELSSARSCGVVVAAIWAETTISCRSRRAPSVRASPTRAVSVRTVCRLERGG